VSAPITQDPGHQENPRFTPLGPRLKEQREKRGITLDQISQTTKIGTRFLQALEEDHFEQLPGGIFNKGFVRAYARCVGIDEEQAVADYLTATGANQPKIVAAEEPPVLEPPAKPPRERAAGLPWGIFATLLLIIAFTFAVWGFYSRVTSTREKELTQAPQAAPAAAKQSPLNEPPSPQTPNQSQPSPASPKNSSSATSGGRTIPNANLLGTEVPAIVASTENPAQGGLVLRIKAREDSWLSITVDGEVTSGQILAAAAEKTVRAQNAILIRAGNIGALDFEFKGKPLPVQGALGEVKTLAFDANGWHTVRKPSPPPESSSPPESPPPPEAEPQP
jgi:cytoskeleton protein RodZ